MNTYAIRTENLGRTFGAVKAVDALSLEVPGGQVFGFLGPNGAGKTTTIRLLLGLLEATGGRAEVLGYDTRSHAGEVRARCGALLEHNGLYERLSAEDNLEFYGRVWRIPKAERKARIKDVLEKMELWERRKELAGAWSRGMKQKLAVARVLLHRPELIFLDEPTAGLDPVAAAALREDLASLVEAEGVTVFLTTHNLAEAEKLCRRIGVIRQGRLLAVGEPAELRSRSASNRIVISGYFSEGALAGLGGLPQVAGYNMKNGCLYVEMAPGAEAAPVIGLLVGSGAQVEEVRKDTASLEDVFLILMEEER